MSRGDKQPPALPSVHQLPVEYDPDVLRVAQRHADQMKMIAELEHAVREWKERALVAEKLNNTLDQHIKNVEGDFSREREEARAQYKNDVDRLVADRDHWRDQYVRVEENLTTVGQIILDVMNKSALRKEATDKTAGAMAEIADAILHKAAPPQQPN